MQIPQTIQGWTIVAVGLLLAAYRARGMWAPRQWVEETERRFTYAVNLRLFGGIVLLAAGALAYFGGLPPGAIGLLFLACIALLGFIGLGLLLFQNHLRLLLVATAESGDTGIRVVSIFLVLLGLLIAAVPFL